MIQKLFKTGLSLVLVFSLVLLPVSSVSSQTITDLTTLQSDVDTTTASALTGTKTDFEDVIALAEKKASTLTSIYGVTSVQYALIDNGKIVLSGQEGVYSKESDKTLTDTNMYGIGSISKMFTTTAIMQLVEQGKVNLNSPVVTYLPEFTMEDTRYKDITVRMLLNHSSGLMGSSLENALLFDDRDFSSYDNLLNKLKTSRLKANPGAFSVYCNDGFTLAELIVEEVTGISFTEYIRKYITNPIGLENTKTPLDQFPKDNLVKTYLPGSTISLPNETLNMIGAGGIYSSAKDLCRFSEIFMNRGAFNSLYSSSLRAMENSEYLNGLWPAKGDSLISYGLGWDSVDTYPFDEYGIKALVKGGDTTLFHGSMIVLPEENMAIAILSSGGSSTYNQVMAQKILLTALQAKGRIDEIKPDKTFSTPVQASMPSELKQYEGFYGLISGLLKITISDDGILTLSNALVNTGEEKYVYTGDGKFYYADGSTYLSFVDESNGNTYLYCNGYSLLPELGQIPTSEYQGQKLSNNVISSNLLNLWQERASKNYFVVSEKYSSQLYLLSSLTGKFPIPTDLQGYWINAAIIDESTAQTLIQIPGVYGRDLSDFTFFNVDDTEYLNLGGNICIAEDTINSFSTKSSFTCSIAEDGYAIWYKIDENSANKQIKVIHPKKAAFVVYDENNTCINYSYTSKEPTVTLPSEGYIVFVGDAGSEFKVKYLN